MDKCRVGNGELCWWLQEYCTVSVLTACWQLHTAVSAVFAVQFVCSALHTVYSAHYLHYRLSALQTVCSVQSKVFGPPNCFGMFLLRRHTTLC